MSRCRLYLVLLACPLGSPAAQEFRPSEASEFQRPLGFSSQSDLARPVETSRDASGNGVAIRRGQASALAPGNMLNVTVQGSGNTVVVNSSQVNSGASSAILVLNGQLGLGG